MLSVCIPIYNVDVCLQVRWLQKHAGESAIEIVLLDDGSTELYRQAHRLLADAKLQTYYYENPQNLGRSRTRNRLAELAQGDYLLLLDAGHLPILDTYIYRYESLALSQTCDFAFGGYRGPEQCPGKDYRLRYHYGRCCEEVLPSRCQELGGVSFLSGNALIRKTLLLEHPFEEGLHQYGYEDTLLGLTLEKAEARYLAIDNPIRRRVDTNAVFLNKTDLALENLVQLYRSERDLSGIRLIRVYQRLQKFRVVGLFRWLLCYNLKPLRHRLAQGTLGTTSFQAYKLGRFLELLSVS